MFRKDHMLTLAFRAVVKWRVSQTPNTSPLPWMLKSECGLYGTFEHKYIKVYLVVYYYTFKYINSS